MDNESVLHVEYYSAAKKNKIMKFARKWIVYCIR